MKLYHQFIHDVTSGDLNSNKFVKLAVKRHLSDMEKSKFEEYPYHFDEDVADRVIRIIKKLRHTGGSFAQKRFDLQPFQAFMLCQMFGWVSKKTGLRRFKKVYIETAKKSGKSEFAAAIEIFMCYFDGESGAQIFTAATTRMQADYVFKPVKIMLTSLVNESKKLKSITRIMRNEVINTSSNSYIKTLTAESNKNDGFNIHCGIVDEFHAHTTSAMIANMESGTVSRDQALIMIITTAGFNKNGPCYEYRNNIVAPVLEGTLELDSLFAIIFTIDDEDIEHFNSLDVEDITEENLQYFKKANPNIGNSPKWGPLIQQAKEAKKSGGNAIVEFLTKSLNIWVDASVQWIASKDWSACGSGFDLNDMKGRKCYGGLDLSKVEDLSAFSLLFIPTKDEFAAHYRAKDVNRPRLDAGEISQADYDILVPRLKFYTHTQYYCPDSKVNGNDFVDGVDYRKWAEEGHIKVTSGNVIDYDYIKSDIIKAAELYDIQFIEYDRFLSNLIVPQLLDEGIPMSPFGQGFLSMSQPSKDLYTMVRNNDIIHNNNPIDKWHVSNAITITDAAGNIKIDKQKGSNKVDGVVSMIMAIGGYSKDKEEFVPIAGVAMLDGEEPIYD